MLNSILMCGNNLYGIISQSIFKSCLLLTDVPEFVDINNHAFNLQYINSFSGALHTDMVNQANPYRSESYLHRAYRYILKSMPSRAKELKNGPCKQAVRSYWIYYMLPIIPYESTQNYAGFC